MLRKFFVIAATFLLLASCSINGFAQWQPLGLPQFTTNVPLNSVESIDLGNNNIHIAIPIRSRSGSSIAFSSYWQYDSDVWGWSSWTNGPGWVNSGITAHGFISTADQTISHTTYNFSCSGIIYHFIGNFIYRDMNGTGHPFSGGVSNQPCTGYSSSLQAADEEGDLLNVSVDSNLNLTTLEVTTASGVVIDNLANTVTDPNGNKISKTTGSTYTYTDTLATTVLTATPGPPSNAATYTYTYTGEGGSESIVVHATNLGTQGNFTACGSSSTPNPIIGYSYYPTSIVLPDGSQYSFTWQQGAGGSGTTTGYLASITFPTGGWETYTYSGGNGGNNCDGSINTITRKVNDGTGTFTWTYVHTGPNSSNVTTTTVTDPALNKAVYTFYQASVPVGGTSYGTPYEIQRQINSGSSTLLKTVVTCYNGQSQSTCASIPNSFTTLTQITRYTELPNSSGVESEVNENYDSNQRISERDEYDFGGGAVGALLRKTLFWYGTWNPSTGQTTALGGNILDLLGEACKYNGSGVLVTCRSFNRDAKGNPLGIYQDAGAYNLVKSYTYNANGTVATFKDVNGDSYSYIYGDCNAAFPTSLSEPAGLSKSMTWNCDGAVMTSVTDEAGATTNTDFSGEYFWRPDYVKDAMGNETTFSYTPTTYESVLNFGSSTVDKLITYDGLGRIHVSQQRQGPGSSNFDSVETDYNSDGQVSRVTQPYQAGAGATNSTAPATTYTNYDGLGRVGTTTDGGGGVISFGYSQNIITKTITPVPSGETAKSWAFQFDGLGRTINVCEGSGGGNWGTCSFNGWNGYWTKYTYDALGDLTGVTQNAQSGTPQTRSYAYDAMGRITSEINPESGTTAKTYSYDKTQTGAGAGDLYTTRDQNGVTITYTYGTFHRLTQASTGSFCRNFAYDSSTGPNSGSTYYLPGRLAEAYTTNCAGTTYTTEYLGYDADGRTTDLWESTTNSGGLYHVTDQYFPNGVVNTLLPKNSSGSSFAGFPYITYSVDGEGRPTTVAASSGTNPVTAASYYTTSGTGASIGQFAGLTFGSGDSASYQYDPNTGRMTQYQFSINGSHETGALTWNPNGTLQKLAITDPFNSSDAQTCTYTYDPIARLSQANCGTTWGQNFGYDAYGNLTKTVISGDSGLNWQPGYTNNNQYSLPGITYDYDGNLTNDTFNTYTWSAFGEVTAIGSEMVTHDAFGRVAEYVNGSTIRQLLYAPSGAKIAKMNGQNLDTAWVPLPGGAIADYHSSGFNAYGYADWLGTTRLGSTSGRQKDADWAVAPFGEVYVGGSPSYGVFTGNGNFNVLNSLMWDFSMREYHSSQGRWLSPDPSGLAAVSPMNPQTWNRYAYVGGAPLIETDPSGLGGPLDLYGDCIGCNPYMHSAGDKGSAADEVVLSVTSADTAIPPAGQVAAFISSDYSTVIDSTGSLVPGGYVTSTTLMGNASAGSGGANPVPSMLLVRYLQAKLILSDTVRNFVDEYKQGGCVNVFGSATAGALNPFSLSLSSAGGGTAAVLGASKYNAAVQYAASQTNYLGGTGLIYPMKSSVVRSMVADANATAASGGLMSLDLALGQGFGTEMYNMATGGCH